MGVYSNNPDYWRGRSSSRGGGGVAVQAEIDEASFRQVNEALARLMVTHPDTKKRIKKMLQEEAKKVRRNISKDVHDNMPNDPRRAYAAVKRSLYRKILGFNVSILNPRRGVKVMSIWRPHRKLDDNPNQRGGNRRRRSDRTNQVDGYIAAFRAFVLRFNNSGTNNRETRFGNRGAIRTRRVFETSASFQMEGAMNEISQMIEEIMSEEFNKA